MRHVTVALAVTTFSDGERSSSARLDVRTEGPDGARAWADALGAEPQTEWHDDGSYVFESGRCQATVDGVLVDVTGSRSLTAEEAAAWRAAGDQGQDADR